MDQPANPDFLTDITDALDWWRGAGVDCDFLDEPRSWIAPPEPPADERPAIRTAPAEEPATPRLDEAKLPQELSAFVQWWMSEPMLDEGSTRGRVAPQGPANPKLMVIVDDPDTEDREALLTGTNGRLLEAMLQAFGMKREEVYLASALPRHTPAADWAAMAQHGIGDVLAHHIRLVRPERLFVPSGHILPLLGHELPQGPAALRQFNQQGATIPMLVSWGLPSLRQPRTKMALWKTWLEWKAT